MEASKHLRIQWSPEFPNYFCVHILERLRDQLRAFPDINLKFLYVCMLYYEKVDMISRTQRCFILETYTRKKFPINIFFLGLKHPCLDWENGLWFPDLLYKLQRYTGLTLFFIKNTAGLLCEFLPIPIYSVKKDKSSSLADTIVPLKKP